MTSNGPPPTRSKMSSGDVAQLQAELEQMKVKMTSMAAALERSEKDKLAAAALSKPSLEQPCYPLKPMDISRVAKIAPDAQFRDYKIWELEWLANARLIDAERYSRSQQVAAVLAALGPHAAAVVESVLGINPDDSSTNVQTILKALRSHYRATQSLIVDRFELISRRQKDGMATKNFCFGRSHSVSRRATQDFLKTWGILHRVSSPMFSQSNGLAENAVQSLKAIVKKTKPGDDRLIALMEQRAMPQACGRSAAELFYGRPISTLVPSLHGHLARLSNADMSAAMRKASEGRSDRQRRYDVNSRPLPPLKVDQDVFVQDQRQSCGILKMLFEAYNQYSYFNLVY
ncbi:hypothetical protein TCAL_16763 [Tigriopus californicus]|uniref:Integrase catalytic domain-containing protein n=1 Tax=Tigriopus californicus TaxID=6832 RepID=A0A553PSM3_TIGCA|nr:hypothetical protein TCAL_16763 [Tigriopus californicus]